jgi:exopolyphosphatase/pppGpp-phosphohydrolase
MLEQTEYSSSTVHTLSTAPVRAAIDIGSNTVHLVVARCLPDNLEILVDELELVRIGESVNATGAISPEKRDQTIATLQKYQELAMQYAAESVLVVATEAIRQASNGEEFLAAILEATGLVVHIIGGDVEATLTFYGATYELDHNGPAPATIGVMDLGGGSMELVTARRLQITWSTSVPIGSGWLHDRYLPSDPPTREEFVAAQEYLKAYFQDLPVQDQPAALIVVGGSANTLLHLARYSVGVSQTETGLTYEDVVHCEGLLRALPADEVAQRYTIALQRARILPAGALIIRMLMERLQLKEIHVSTHGIREGVLLARARYGESWLAQLQGEASDPVQQSVPETSAREDAAAETFAASGRRLLLQRTRSMLEWRKEVLKHEDIEAVHKMRVASRRLRAVLDAYELVCEPKQFKKVYRRVKALADILGKARDTDVMIENLQAQMEHVPVKEQAGMQWLIDRLSVYRQQHQHTLEAFLRDRQLDEDVLLQQMKACLPERGC